MLFMSYAGLFRAIRRHADLSQRQLAARSGVSVSVISRVEAGRQFPLAGTVEKLLHATGYRMQLVGPGGETIDTRRSWQDCDQPRDGANRRFPAHLDVRPPTPRRPWWYHLHTTDPVTAPLLTFDLCRSQRNLWRRADVRGPTDPDQRMNFPGRRSRVEIPGWRPTSKYGGRSYL